jgi:7-keto-8-aminopelargonate synthetase-like enzyme
VRPVGCWGLAVLALSVAMSGCGNAGSGLYTGNPLHYLITIDQLMVSDFTVFSTAQQVDAATLAGGNAAIGAALTKDSLRAAASVEYQRPVDFSTSNGPLDVVATVARFATVAGATSAYTTGVHQLEATSGAVAASTGPLGDQAHSISVVKPTASGISAVEITVEWRVGNLLNIIVARGRYGGTRLDDALTLANQQARNEEVPPSS